MTELPTNSPAPIIDPRIQQKLADIGGLVSESNSEYAGQPVFRLVWGQTEKSFDSGKPRIRFFEPNTDPIFIKRAFRLSQKGLNELVKWQKRKTVKMRDAVNSADWKLYHTLLFTPAEFFMRQYISAQEWERLNDNASAEDTAKLLPEGWFYFEDMPEVIEIGSPRWYVVEFTPAHKIDTRESWDRNRFGVLPLLELNGDKHFVDILGPYPENGYYFNVIAKVETEDGKYAQPDDQNCIEKVRKHLYYKNAATVQQTTLAFRHNFRESVLTDAYNAMIKTRSEWLKDKMTEEGQVHYPDPNYKKNPKAIARIYPKEDRINWGKPVKSKE